MEWLLGVLLIVLEIVAIVDLLRGRLKAAKKALWIILIIVLPVLGLFLYFLLGRAEKVQSA